MNTSVNDSANNSGRDSLTKTKTMSPADLVQYRYEMSLAQMASEVYGLKPGLSEGELYDILKKGNSFPDPAHPEDDNARIGNQRFTDSQITDFKDTFTVLAVSSETSAAGDFAVLLQRRDETGFVYAFRSTQPASQQYNEQKIGAYEQDSANNLQMSTYGVGLSQLDGFDRFVRSTAPLLNDQPAACAGGAQARTYAQRQMPSLTDKRWGQMLQGAADSHNSFWVSTTSPQRSEAQMWTAFFRQLSDQTLIESNCKKCVTRPSTVGALFGHEERTARSTGLPGDIADWKENSEPTPPPAPRTNALFKPPGESDLDRATAAYFDVRRVSATRFLQTLLIASTCLALTACEPMVRGTMNAANSISNSREASRQADIAQSSLKRYQTMADVGDPKGFYYLAIAYALNHQEEPDAILEIKRRYEDAVARGSNDAKVALGLMLVTGDSHPFVMDGRLPLEHLDPNKGLALLKSAEAQSCSFTQPLVSLGRCREREISIASEVSNIYFNGAHTWIVDEAAKAQCKKNDFACLGKAGHWQQVLPKDRRLSEEWARRRDECGEKIAAINRARQCF